MKNAAAASRCAGRTISTADDFSVAANAYGRSVCVISATVKMTNRIVGSPSAPNVRSRLEPSCAYGLPLSIAASETAKLARPRMKPPPRMSPM